MFATRANSVPGLNSGIFATFGPAYFSSPKVVFSVAGGGRKWVRPGKTDSVTLTSDFSRYSGDYRVAKSPRRLLPGFGGNPTGRTATCGRLADVNRIARWTKGGIVSGAALRDALSWIRRSRGSMASFTVPTTLLLRFSPLASRCGVWWNSRFLGRSSFAGLLEFVQFLRCRFWVYEGGNRYAWSVKR